MLIKHTNVALLAILAGAAGCAAPQQEAERAAASTSTASPSRPRASGTPVSTPAAWSEFRSEEGRFSVMLPGVPEAKSSDVATVSGPQAQHEFNLIVRPEGGRVAAYMTSYSDFAPGGVAAVGEKAFLDKTWSQSSLSMGPMVYQRVVDFKGRSALEWQARREAKGRVTLLTGRNVLVGDRLYQMAAIMNEQQTLAGDAARYLDSFEAR